MATFLCPLCGEAFVGVHSITRHRDNLKKPWNDPCRCDNRKRTRTQQTDSASEGDSDESLQAFITEVFNAPDTPEPPQPAPAPPQPPQPAEPNNVVLRPLAPVDVLSFTRRKPAWAEASLVTRARIVTKQARGDHRIPRDLTQVQERWETYIRAIYDLYSPKFWNFFLHLHKFPATDINTALSAASETFGDGKLKDFPLSKRKVMTGIDTLPPFWVNVMCHSQITVPDRLTQKHKHLPERLKVINFNFIDPIWAWVSVAVKQPPSSLHWIPKVKIHPNHARERYYGAGVQYGESFVQASRTCPAGTYPALVQLSWDGAHAHGTHATPICVGVGNTNSLAAETKCCIAYLSVLEDMGAQHEGVSTEIRSFVKQQCIESILRVIENYALVGVRVRIPSTAGSTAEMTLMPRLFALNLDLKDARMYYGLRSECSCSKCKRRKGRSAFRLGSRQSGRAVQALYDIVENNDNEVLVREASQKLSRWGFHPLRRCRLTIACREALIRRPGYEDEVFPALDFRDRMHGLFVFMHRQICECLIRMKLPQATRVRLDRRLVEIGLTRVFQDPDTGRSYRVQHSLFTEANMSAADRVCTLFYLPHVFGHRALDLTESAREPFLTAISWAQVFAVSSRGGRSYNEREFREIFERGWVVCFGALERLYQINFDRTHRKQMQRHRKNPRKHKAPTDFQRTSR